MDTDVTSIDFDNKVVYTDNGEKENYDTLILATGSIPIAPNIYQEEISKTFTL